MIFRLERRPNILIYDFKILDDQARAFNRLALFIEKKGTPKYLFGNFAVKSS